MIPRAHAAPRLALPVLLAVYAGLAIAALLGDASVADEHPHIASGWLFWESGRFSGGLDNPPLGQLLVAAPLRILGIDYRFPDDGALVAARLPVVVLLVALAWLAARWTQELLGAAAAALALAMFCLEPNLIAHGHLATLDVPLTFFWWATLWQWRRVLHSSQDAATTTWRPWIGFFCALALAVFTKFTGLFLLPACALVALVALPTARSRWRVLGLLGLASVALVVVSHLVYGFGATRYGLPATLVDAMAGKLAHRAEGHFSYLMGRRSVSGFPEYYLITLLVKTPLPLLGCAAIGAVAALKRWTRLDRALLAIPAALLVVVFSLVGVNIGVRHILPVYPALVIAACLGMRVAWRPHWGRAALLASVLLWIVGVVRVAPQQLSYFNVIAGGAAGGDRWLIDSNLDWGQDDRRLQRFLDAARGRGEKWVVNPPGARARTGRIVVNANTLHNLMRRDPEPYDWLRRLQPSGFAGASWRRYDLDVDDFATVATERPNDVTAQVAYAEVVAQHRGWDDAEPRYAGLAPALDHAPRLYRSAIESALQAHDWAAAWEWARRGLARNPGDTELGAWAQRAQMERVAAESQEQDDVGRAHAGLGLWWAERGDVQRASVLLRDAAQRLPHDVEVVRALGVAEARRGLFAAAVRVFERAPVAAALRAEAAACRALAATEAALETAARTERGSATSPGVGGRDPASLTRPDRDAWMELATTHFDDGRYDRAAAALVEILRDDSTDAVALALLSEMQVRAKLRIVDATITPRTLRRVTPEPLERP